MRQFAVAALYVGFSILVSTVLRAQEVPCYAPDGKTVAPNDSFVPCNKLGVTQRGVFSSCCLLDGEPDNRDLCATSGLCLNRGIVRREYCTDPSWTSPACVKLCVDPQWGGSVNGSVEMTPCTDGTFCCGHNNLTCCGTEWAIRVPTQASINGGAANTTITATVTATPDPSGPGIGAVVGLAAALGVVLLLAIGVFFYFNRQNRALKSKNADLLAAVVAAEHHDGTAFHDGLGGGPGGPGGPGGQQSYRPLSYMPGSSAATMVAPSGGTSSHVPSMQEFTAFKAMYGSVLAMQNAQEMANHQRYSELDGATAAAAAQRQYGNMGSPPPFEQIREVEHAEHRGSPAPGTQNPS
jgi:hypothetical protein